MEVVLQCENYVQAVNVVGFAMLYVVTHRLMKRETILGSLSKDVFERRTSTGSDLFSLLVCLDANKFVLLSFFSPLKTIYSRVSTKPLPNDAKSSLPVDVRRSKTLLLKLPQPARDTNSEMRAKPQVKRTTQEPLMNLLFQS